MRAIPFVERGGLARGEPGPDEGTGRGSTPARAGIERGRNFVLLAGQFLSGGDVGV